MAVNEEPLSFIPLAVETDQLDGTASYVVRGTAGVKGHGNLAFEDFFTGDSASAGAAAYVVAPLNFILWEFRFLVYFVACYYLATNTIRSKRDVRAIVVLSLVVMTLFGLEGTYRKLALVDTDGAEAVLRAVETAYSAAGYRAPTGFVATAADGAHRL